MVVLKSFPGFYFWNRDLFLPNAPTCRLTPGSFQRLGSRQVWRSKSHGTQDRVLASTWDRRARPCPSHPRGPHKLLQAQGGRIYRKTGRAAKLLQGFPGGPVAKNLPAHAEDAGSIPDQGRSDIPQSSLASVGQLLLSGALQQEKPLH